ncbi:hypothetical protein CTAYLR_002430 [Chrysophaeum taylorii]|uniref:Uncharacterized protein n=1 Tax=Chrysophaeum taylorii TaxID=2483200 RepID=A0AAD7UP32_9STRA|nr:hypothetical protein CTAYLR_002430 [Chrysophaeum taylorii]
MRRGRRLLVAIVVVVGGGGGGLAALLAMRAHHSAVDLQQRHFLSAELLEATTTTTVVVVGPRPQEEAAPRARTFERFHGMYLCTVGTPCPSYSAGFLTSRAQLLSNPVTDGKMRRANTNMETASYHTMGGPRRYNVWRTVDALDFAVEHLSMYERMLQSQRMPKSPPSPLASALYETFLERLRRYESRLKAKCGGDGPSTSALGPKSRRTVGIMPYYAAGGAGSGHTRFESKALYLNATIRSLRCHFGAVAVSCLHPGDRAYLEKGIGRPYLDDILWIDPEEDLPVRKPSFLGVATIRAMQRRWTDPNSTWHRRYDFAYYTEADQILHLRAKHRDRLYDCLDGVDGGSKLGILTPHRLNALPRSQDFEDVFRAFGQDEDARTLRRVRFGLDDQFDPTEDAWYGNLFRQNGARGGFLRRELDGYGAKNITRVDDDLANASCCYLKSNEADYPYLQRGKSGGVRLDDTRAGDFGLAEDRPSPRQAWSTLRQLLHARSPWS